MKIPPHALKVFTGVIFDVYQWEQTMFDGTKQTFEMLKRPDKVQIIPVLDGKICISKQSQPHLGGVFYDFFGGRVESGEDIQQTAKRELLEESGLTTNNLVEYMSHHPQEKIDWTIHTFIAHDCKLSHTPTLDAGEKIEMLTCTFDEFVEIVLSESFRDQHFASYVLRCIHNSKLQDLAEALLSN